MDIIIKSCDKNFSNEQFHCKVFDSEWHKLHFGVFRDKVVLYVNCEPVGEQPLQLVNSRIDLNGQILIAKVAGN